MNGWADAKPSPVDVRIIAATNRDLEKLITEGQFREDLYYRLKVITIWLPPLGRRDGDIPLLSEYFLARYAAEIGIDPPGITKEALKVLEHHTWPGNVRELANTLQKILIFNRGMPISADDIAQATGSKPEERSDGTATVEEAIRLWARQQLMAQTGEAVFEACVDRFAALLLAEALSITGGNRSRAAKLLGLSRPTLHSKIDKYNLEIQTSVKKSM